MTLSIRENHAPRFRRATAERFGCGSRSGNTASRVKRFQNADVADADADAAAVEDLRSQVMERLQDADADLLRQILEFATADEGSKPTEPRPDAADFRLDGDNFSEVLKVERYAEQHKDQYARQGMTVAAVIKGFRRAHTASGITAERFLGLPAGELKNPPLRPEQRSRTQSTATRPATASKKQSIHVEAAKVRQFCEIHRARIDRAGGDIDTTVDLFRWQRKNLNKSAVDFCRDLDGELREHGA